MCQKWLSLAGNVDQSLWLHFNRNEQKGENPSNYSTLVILYAALSTMKSNRSLTNAANMCVNVTCVMNGIIHECALYRCVYIILRWYSWGAASYSTVNISWLAATYLYITEKKTNFSNSNSKRWLHTINAMVPHYDYTLSHYRHPHYTTDSLEEGVHVRQQEWHTVFLHGCERQHWTNANYTETKRYRSMKRQIFMQIW